MEKISNSPGLLIICAIIGIIIISVACYYIARRMKGSLTLELNQKSISSGQQITATLTAKVKKDLIADRLYVSLIGEREQRGQRISSDGSSSSKSDWVEFYRDETDILMDTELPAGSENVYDIVIDAPSEDQTITGSQAISNVAENMENGMAKSIVAGLGAVAGATASLRGGRKRWKVISRLETKGVDL